MMNGDVAGLLHTMREHGVSGRGKYRDPGQHKILAKVHGEFKGLLQNISPQSHRDTEKSKT
jgi:hypothetical protein